MAFLQSTEVSSHPLQQFPIFQSSDIEEAQDLIARNFSRHSLSVLSSRQKLSSRYDGLFFHNIGLMCGTYGADVKINPESNEYFFTQTTLAGHTRVSMAGEEVETDNGTTVVVSPTTQYEMHLGQGSSRLIAMFEREALETQLSKMLNAPLRQPLEFDLGMSDCNGQRSAWLRSLDFLCDQFSITQDLASNAAFLQHANDLLITQLLNSQSHNYSEQLHHNPVVHSPRHVRRAIAYIEEHIHEPISLAAMASTIGVTSRTLQKGFLKYVDASPSDYIRQLRLRCIHDELIRANELDTQVSTVLMNYGITSFGHFSKLYKTVYQCTPAETLRQR
jgi:AraC-like DNA-binding protein